VDIVGGIGGAAWTGSGVGVVAAPDLVAFDTEGAEVGRSPDPGSSSRLTTTLTSGFGVLFGNRDGGFFARYDATAAETERQELPLPDDEYFYWAAAERDAVAHALTLSGMTLGEFTIDLHVVRPGEPVASQRMEGPFGPDAAPYVASGQGVVSATGELLFCVRRQSASLQPDLLRLDPGTGATSLVPIGTLGAMADPECNLYAASSGVVAIWAQRVDGQGTRAAATISEDGSSVLSEPVGVTPRGPAVGAASLGNDIVVLVNDGDKVFVQRYSVAEGRWIDEYQVDYVLPPLLEFTGAAIATDGERLYVALGVPGEFGPGAVVLLKLNPLPAP
jgi:hypothetical protein